MPKVELVGRSSSHFTRVAAIFALELGVPYELRVVHDVLATDPGNFGGHPALKLPVLRVDGSLLVGTENICRRLHELSGGQAQVVWPEALKSDLSRNAQELVWHAMAAQVQLVIGTVVAKLPADHAFFSKIRLGFEGSLQWLDSHLEQVVALLPSGRLLSLFEVTLFCLLEHIPFRPTVSLEPYPALRAFSAKFSRRPAAQQTPFRFDPKA